jgi:hypothetical protein
MKKKQVELKKLTLNKEKIVALSPNYSALLLGGAKVQIKEPIANDSRIIGPCTNGTL